MLYKKIGSTGVLFLQETHSSCKVEQKWNNDFKDHVFFSHGKTNSCVVLTANCVRWKRNF